MGDSKMTFSALFPCVVCPPVREEIKKQIDATAGGQDEGVYTCPSCNKDFTTPGSLGRWFDKDGNHVCDYVICRHCFQVGGQLPPEERSKFVAAIEERIGPGLALFYESAGSEELN